eukprot:4926398-Prymnesium_polylepis.1
MAWAGRYSFKTRGKLAARGKFCGSHRVAVARGSLLAVREIARRVLARLRLVRARGRRRTCSR